MMEIKWNYAVETAIALWVRPLHHPRLQRAGVAHFYEHLLFRRLRRALNERNDLALIANARTQVDHFYLHLSVPPRGSAMTLLENALSSSAYDLNEFDFEEERKIVLNEMTEANSFNEVLLGQLQQRHFGTPTAQAGILGKSETLLNLRWSECRDDLLSLAPAATLARCAPDVVDRPHATLALKSGLGIQAKVEAIKVGKRHAVVCTFLLDNPSPLQLVQLQVFEQILRHRQGDMNINSLVRDRYGISYGFHGLQIPNAGQHLSALVAMCSSDPPPSLIDELKLILTHAQQLIEHDGSWAADRLRVEHALYGHAQNDLHFFPAMLTRFGSIESSPARRLAMIDAAGCFDVDLQLEEGGRDARTYQEA